MKHYTVMKQKDFDTIKQLHDLKLTGKQIQDITNRSNGVICNVKRSNTFADYQAIGRSYKIKPVNLNVLESVTKQEVLKPDPSVESELIKQLKDINANLVLLTEAWNTKPIKKTLF